MVLKILRFVKNPQALHIFKSKISYILSKFDEREVSYNNHLQQSLKTFCMTGWLAVQLSWDKNGYSRC